MIHYHGTPMTPIADAAKFFAKRHAMVSYATHAKGGADQLPVIAEVAQSFVLDNGAFTAWKAGKPITDWSGYYAWSDEWLRHPGCEWALIPDVIDGDETANNELIEQWPHDRNRSLGVPVWHLHESIERLWDLCDAWPRVAIGSSGQFANIGTRSWWERIAEAMVIVCDQEGRPTTKLHGLRMLDPTVFTRIPFASADSTNVARNMGLDTRWAGRYAPKSDDIRALVIADRIESYNSPACWSFDETVCLQDRLFTLAPTRYMVESGGGGA